MLLKDTELTSEILQNNDLIAILDKDETTVTIIKNKYSNELGLFTFEYYNKLVSKYEGNTYTGGTQDTQDTQDIKGIFNSITETALELIEDISKTAKETIEIAKPEIEELVESFQDSMKQVEKEKDIAKLEMIRETALELGVETDLFLSNIEHKITILKK